LELLCQGNTLFLDSAVESVGSPLDIHALRYFMRERIWSALESDQRTVLFFLSIVSEIPDVCRNLFFEMLRTLGISNPSATRDALVRDRFVSVHSDSLSISPMFADLVREVAEGDFSPGQRDRIVRAASKYLQRSGRLLDAATALFSIHD